MHVFFNVDPLNSLFRQIQLERLQYWGPDASVDTHINYGHIPNMGIMAIVTWCYAIDIGV